jgi:hypothetical protein
MTPFSGRGIKTGFWDWAASRRPNGLAAGGSGRWVALEHWHKSSQEVPASRTEKRRRGLRPLPRTRYPGRSVQEQMAKLLERFKRPFRGLQAGGSKVNT